MGDEMILGPLGIDPGYFGLVCAFLLFLFVLYLIVPRGARVEYFGAYPKRYTWSSRTKAARERIRHGGGVGGGISGGASISSIPADARSIGISTLDGGASSYTGGPGTVGGSSVQYGGGSTTHRHLPAQGIGPAGTGGTGVPGASYSSGDRSGSLNQRRSVGTSGRGSSAQYSGGTASGGSAPVFDASRAGNLLDLSPHEEIVISAAMQQLRDPGVLVVAHGSKGKPKTVRLRLVESAISWRTEQQRKKPSQSGDTGPKLGKLHHVPLSHILYVDVGKQTTALRRVENAAVSEDLCFSLLTKEGSLDLECNSARERDALVSCFSLVLDEVHASNWRDVQRVPSSDMPSSFDGGDEQMV
mmetsp:Transcript_11098/g.24017  ORF Transcript_11098/g.24017 Transcript_11098/m.24017 type:complete len:358 (-) Transcript_11098:70-1143(-)